MARKLSNADQTYLSPEQQKQIEAFKKQYAAASNLSDPDLRAAAQKEAHEGAEAVRAQAANGGYSAGADGTGYTKKAAGQGGQTAQQVADWANAYKAANWDPKLGWTNGYDVDMNTRARANYIRQQMEANSKAWYGATPEEQAYLHDQNRQLADILAKNTGHVVGGESYGYDNQTGRWWTEDANNGYGQYTGYNQPNVRNSLMQAYGYTDAQMEKWANDRSGLYRNFVDAGIPARNQMDESGGFTGRYAQFANGPHIAILGTGTNVANMSNYADVVGDGFNDENDYAATILPEYDEDGNIIKRKPALKGNNGVSDYTKQFAAYTQNGLIMPNSLQMTNPGNANANRDAYLGAVRQTGGAGLEDNMSDYQKNGKVGNDPEGQAAYKRLIQKNTGLTPNGVSRGAGSGSGAGSYLEQLYANALEAQKAQLESSYKQGLSDLEASETKTADQYREQRRQTTGQSAQDSAAWREIANAYGLNSGAIGQGVLAQNTALQENLGTLYAGESATMDEIERTRVALGQQYQTAINQAVAENNMQKAQALYQEAVRQEQQLLAQMQFAAQMNMQQKQLDAQNAQWAAEFAAKQTAAQAATGTGGGSPVMLAPEYERLNALYSDASRAEIPENYISDNAKLYGFDKTTGLADYYKDTYLPGTSRAGELSYRFSAPHLQNDLTYEQKVSLINSEYGQGNITAAQWNSLIRALGVA